MGNSDALKKLKNEFEKEKKKRSLKAEWIFKIFKKPRGLLVDHMGEVHQLTRKELEDLMRGYLKGEYFMDVIYDEEGKAVHVMKMIDLSRYTWLPKYMYRRFLKAVCDTLGLVYRPFMLEAVTARRLTPKAMVEFGEKPFWHEPEERAKELAEKYEYVHGEIEALERFFKMQKEKERLKGEKKK